MKKITLLLGSMFFCCLISSSTLHAQSTKMSKNGNDTLIVYTDVPGLTPSEFYKIRVRLAGTTEWHESFAHITRSLYADNVDNVIKAGANYFGHLSGWSHTYNNIEMNAPVEVELAKVNGDPIKKAVVHPLAKVIEASITDGKVYFTIENPGQLTIDIDGQMDDQNTGRDYAGPAIHTVSVYANPIMDKPDKDASGVVVVSAGTDPPTDPNTFETVYFDAGIHDLGLSYKVHANKKYYIAGDAIVYGTFTNVVKNNGHNIKIYGYGTISGAKLKHPTYDPRSPFYGESANPSDGKPWKPIGIDNADNTSVVGVTLDDPCFHSIQMSASNNNIKSTSVKWVKIVTWRANGDGIGNVHLTEDCFIRTQDDCSYVKGDKRRCVFWTDSNGSVFVLATAGSNYRIVVEDCDVIYARSQGKTWEGGRVFSWRAMGSSPGTVKLNLIFRDIRIDDTRPTLQIFNMYSIADFDLIGGSSKDGRIVSSFSGITWQNINAAGSSVLGLPEVLRGCPESPFSDFVFDNVVIAGKTFTSLNDFKYVQNVDAIFNPQITDDATLFDLRLDGNTIPGFDPDTFVYNIQLPAGTTSAQEITATTSDNNAVITAFTHPESLPGVGTIAVTAEDGVTTKIYVINFSFSDESGQASGEAFGDNWDIEDTEPMYQNGNNWRIRGFDIKDNFVPTFFDIENSGLAPGEGVDGSQALKSTISGSDGRSAGVTLFPDSFDISNWKFGEFTFSFLAKSLTTPPNKPFWLIARAYDENMNEVTDETLETLDIGGTRPYAEMASAYSKQSITFIIKPNSSGGNNAKYISLQIQYSKFDNTYWFDEFKMTVPLPPEKGLSDLKVNGLPLDGFDPDITLYNIELPNGTVDVPTVSATASSAGSTIDITDATNLPGVTTVRVSSETGSSKLYTLIFYLAVDKITDITTPSQIIPGETITISVDYQTSELRDLIVELQSDLSNIIYATQTVMIPKGSGTLNLSIPVPVSIPAAVDAYSIMAYLTPEGGTPEDSFHSLSRPNIDVITLSTDATLSDLKIDGTTITNFDSDEVTYSFELPFGTVEAPNVTAETTDANASAVVDDASSLPGNTVILVTAEDGVTSKTYTVEFSLASPATDATLSDLTVDGTAVSGFDPDVEVYDIELAEGTVDVPSVSAVAADAKASVDVTNANSLSESTIVLVTAEDGITTKTYTVNFSVETGSTGLRISGIAVYPNPLTKGYLKIEFANPNLEYSVTVTDIAGRVVLNKSEIAGSCNIPRILFGQSGVYIIKINDGNKSQFVKVSVR